MLSCSHFSTYDGPGPRLGAFVRINFYLISFQLALPLPLQEIRSLSPCFRKSTGDGYRGGRNSWRAPDLSAAPKESVSKSLPHRGCHGPGSWLPSPGQVLSLFTQEHLPNFYAAGTAFRAPCRARRPGSIFPPIPLLPREVGERFGPCIKTRGKLCRLSPGTFLSAVNHILTH